MVPPIPAAGTGRRTPDRTRRRRCVMTATVGTTTYDVEGRLLEVCTCNTLCPCWVGEDPDGDGTVTRSWAGTSTAGRYRVWTSRIAAICVSVHIPGNVLAGNWKLAVLVDDRCSEEQQTALLECVDRSARWRGGRLRCPDRGGGGGRAGADHVRCRRGQGLHQDGRRRRGAAHAVPGRDGEAHFADESVFSTIPGSPAFVGKAESFQPGRQSPRVAGRRGHRAERHPGLFRFSA